MIPTQHKAKLPRPLSYPVGAGSISEALAGAPHYEELSISFWDGVVGSALESRRLLAERVPTRVMTAQYSPARNPGLIGSHDMVQQGWYDERWELCVYPVLAESRHLANRLLRDEGLPAILAWLGSSDRAGWTTTWQQIELTLHPTEGSLSSRVFRGV